jgi:hypothetical protein
MTVSKLYHDRCFRNRTSAKKNIVDDTNIESGGHLLIIDLLPVPLQVSFPEGDGYRVTGEL